MPELPEIETLKQDLQAQVGPCVVRGCHLYAESLREAVDARSIHMLLQQGVVQEYDRRGKYLLMHVYGEDPESRGYRGTLLCHLGMSGRITLHEGGVQQVISTVGEHTHWIMETERGDGSLVCLCYCDPRRFGRLAAYMGEKTQLTAHGYLSRLGVEPLACSVAALGRVLYEASRGRRRSIKAHIMDGGVMVGVGNIYACESLYRASISPQRPCLLLSRKDYERLARAVRYVLRQAIAMGGSTVQSFSTLAGRRGWFPMKAKVYQKAGMPCGRCHAKIVKIPQEGRSTYQCPRCQGEEELGGKK